VCVCVSVRACVYTRQSERKKERVCMYLSHTHTSRESVMRSQRHLARDTTSPPRALVGIHTALSSAHQTFFGERI